MNEQELEQMHRDVAEIADFAEGIREILGLIGTAFPKRWSWNWHSSESSTLRTIIVERRQQDEDI